MNIREWTLPVYTILIQIACGSLLFLWIIRSIKIGDIGQDVLDRIFRYPIVVIFITTLVAMIGAHFHLSRPVFSVFSILNFRTAWLSREIVFNILFFITCAILGLLIWFVPARGKLKMVVGWIAVVFGLAFIYCMARIYLIRTLPAWNTPFTIVFFYLSMILLGLVSLALMLLLDLKVAELRGQVDLVDRNRLLKDSLPWFAVGVAVAAVGIGAANYLEISSLGRGTQAALTSLQLLFSLYRPLFNIRLIAMILGICLFVITIILIVRRNEPPKESLVLFYISCMLVILGEILGRILFYATHVRIGI